MKGEPGQGPYALPAIYSTHSLSTFASGFLFLNNKLEITICNWAGGVWEGEGGLSGERAGERGTIGGGGGI